MGVWCLYRELRASPALPSLLPDPSPLLTMDEVQQRLRLVKQQQQQQQEAAAAAAAADGGGGADLLL